MDGNVLLLWLSFIFHLQILFVLVAWIHHRMLSALDVFIRVLFLFHAVSVKEIYFVFELFLEVSVLSKYMIFIQ